jgi:hypothetical protein
MRWVLIAVALCSCTREEKEQAKPVPAEKAPAKVEPAPTAVVPTLIPPPKEPCSEYAGDYSNAMRERDYSCVRVILVPRLEAKTITQAEARYLTAACVTLGDKECERLARAFAK